MHHRLWPTYSVCFRFSPSPEGLNGVKLMIFIGKKETDHNRLQETYEPLDSNKSQVILHAMLISFFLYNLFLLFFFKLLVFVEKHQITRKL